MPKKPAPAEGPPDFDVLAQQRGLTQLFYTQQEAFRLLGFKESWGKLQVKAGRLRTQTWARKVVMVPS
jgi:hypothetical protein